MSRPLTFAALIVLAVHAVFPTPAMAENKRVTLLPEGGLLVEGKPFLPIFVWAQPSSTLGQQKALGMNAVHAGEREEKDPTAKFLDVAQANQLLALIDHDRFHPSLKDHPAVLAWTVEHEPEMPEDPPYQADLATTPGAIWIEGEQPAESTFAANPWLDKNSAKLSGGKWLTASANGEGRAVFKFEVATAGEHSLWVREFNKPWANPTRWQIDGKDTQETPRSLKAEELMNFGGGRGAGWAKYGVVQLDAGRHTLTFEVVPGRTSGDVRKPTTPDAVWAVDAICFVPGNARFPKAKSLPFTPRRMPSVAKANFEKIKAADPQALCWMVLTGFFHKTYNKVPLSLYDDYLKYTDIVSFDHYPVTGWNQPGRLPEVAQMTRQLVGMARKGQPVWTIIEASDQELAWTAPQTKGPTPQEMRAQAWMSIASGAKGVGYFSIAFGRGKDFKWNHLTEPIKVELKRTNAELSELAGPIVAGNTTRKLEVLNDATNDKVTDGHAIAAIRKEYEGTTYVIAVNMTRQAITPTFKLEGISNKSVEVWKEERQVRLENGAFTDTFEPLAVHIYRMGQ